MTDKPNSEKDNPGHRPGHEPHGIWRAACDRKQGGHGNHGRHRPAQICRSIPETRPDIRKGDRHHRVVPAGRNGHRSTFLRQNVQSMLKLGRAQGWLSQRLSIVTSPSPNMRRSKSKWPSPETGRPAKNKWQAC